MYAITGITGQVGGVLAHTLLANDLGIRAVVRDAKKGGHWETQGCEVAVAEMFDVHALSAAFAGTEAVFILLPPNFDPDPQFTGSRRIITAISEALLSAKPQRVVCLSTIGAQVSQTNLLSQLGLLEQALMSLPMPIRFLRAAWFMENVKWDIDAARLGAVSSFLQPLDRAIPMVSITDVGRVAAELIQQRWSGREVIELEGPCPVAPNDIAAAFSQLLGHEVRMQAIARDRWEQMFTSQGMTNPIPRMQMLDGFNQGWIDFERGPARSYKGVVSLEQALRNMLVQSG